MKKVFFLLTAVLFLASCGNSGEKRIISVEKKIVQKAAVPVAANEELTIQIAGMSCEHACGGAIRTALKKTNAVDRCSFIEFDVENEFNNAKITFDNSKISRDEIVTIIETANDGQFTTRFSEANTPKAALQKS